MPETTIADLLALLTRDPGRPRLTWYGGGGERVELSGAVLVNWVNKTTNLLVEELDVAPGSRVLVDLPTHWRTVLWELATWRAGGCVVLPGAPADVDVEVTDRPTAGADPARSGSQVVVVSLPALARRFDGELPPGALDAAASVMTYGDVIGYAPDPSPDDAAIDGGPTHGALVGWARAQAPETGRVLVPAGPGRTSAHDAAVVLGVLAHDGSVVLVDDAVRRKLDADPERTGRLVASERITATLLG